MKKVLVTLVVLALAVPVWAAVNITCTPGTGADCNLVAVKFVVSGEPNKVSGFGLDIKVDSGAKIKSISDVNAVYWVYPGSIVIINGEVNDVGTPIGDPSKFPGTLGGLDTNGITIEMGALHDPPGDTYLPGSGTLLKFRVDKNCTVTIQENTIRGGVVLTNPSVDPTVNATGCQVVCGGECFPNTYTTYADWKTLNMPDCWCGTLVPAPRAKWPYQCDGDIDNAPYGPYQVYTPDLTIVANNWKKKITDPTLNPCADVTHKPYGAYRVYTDDLTIVATNWKKKPAQLPGNCPRGQ